MLTNDEMEAMAGEVLAEAEANIDRVAEVMDFETGLGVANYSLSIVLDGALTLTKHLRDDGHFSPEQDDLIGRCIAATALMQVVNERLGVTDGEPVETVEVDGDTV